MSQELASIREPVALSPQEALDSAEALMTQQGYNVTERTETSVTGVRRKREGMFGHSLRNLTVVAQPLPRGGVQIKLMGNDREGARDRQAEWVGWGKSLPKRNENQQEHGQHPKKRRALRPRVRTEESLSGAEKTSEVKKDLSEGGQEPIVGGAHQPETPVGDAGSNEQGHVPAAEPGGWSSAAPWNQEPRVASSKRITSPIPPQDKPMDTSESSSGDARQHRNSKVQKDKDRDNYRTLLGLYSQGLDLLERLYAAEREHAYILAHGPDVKEEYEKGRRGAYEQIEGLLESLGKLEDRNLEYTTGEFASRRTELEARHRSIERRAEEQRIAAGPPKPSPEQMEKDRENHQKLLDLYPQYLNTLEEAYTLDKSDPIVQQQFKEILQSVVEGIEDARRKLDILEERTPQLATGPSADRRARLENQWKELRDRDEQTSIARDRRDHPGADKEQERNSDPGVAQTERIALGKVDEGPDASEQSSDAEMLEPSVPQEEHRDNSESEAEDPDAAKVESGRPSSGGSMSGRAAGEGDVSNLIERVEPFEERLGVRLEGLFARNRGKYVEVNGELYSRGGDELDQDIEIVVTVYDASGRVIAVDDYSYFADEFFGFEPFSILARVEGMQPAKIRVHPRVK